MRKLFTVVALLCATTVSLQAQTPDWYNNGKNYFKAVNKNTADNFTMIVMATIDGVRCDDAFEIGCMVTLRQIERHEGRLRKDALFNGEKKV